MTPLTAIGMTLALVCSAMAFWSARRNIGNGSKPHLPLLIGFIWIALFIEMALMWMEVI